MGGARVQRASLARGTRYGFAGPGAPQAQADRGNVLLGLHHGAVMGIELPHPGVVNLRVAELQKPRVGAPGAIVLVHLEQLLMDARVHAGGDWGSGSSRACVPGGARRRRHHPRSQRERCATGAHVQPSQRVIVAALSHALPAPLEGGDHVQATARGNVGQGLHRE